MMRIINSYVFLFESSFKSVKHKIAFFTSVICFKIIQYVY